ncbi:MAG: hypothetical protein JJE04_05930 [Acidobacteriia bacterium]|nr:hypothetical protein [Terriglobia bacterium]
MNFRLSEDEFEKLKSSCELFGARSVSDFARNSVLSRMDQVAPGSEESSGRLVNLDQKVNSLETRVGQLLRLLEASGESTPGEADFVAVNGALGRSASSY